MNRYKSPVKVNENRLSVLKDNVLIQPEICIERIVYLTESYRRTEGETMLLRRAKALAYVLRNMSVYILDQELIVGNYTSKPRSAPLNLDYTAEWIEDELELFEKREQDRFFLSKENKAIIKKMLPYWRGKTPHSRVLSLLPEETKSIMPPYNLLFSNDLTLKTGGMAHSILDYPLALENGLDFLIRKTEQKLAGLDLTKPGDIPKKPFYEAVIISLNAVCDFAERFADLARKQADQETDKERKEELLAIADNCMMVPRYPANSFYQALQSIWLLAIMLNLESPGYALGPGRIDQYLYPYFKRDLEKGEITRDQAKAMLTCFWVKYNEITHILNESATRTYAGFPMEFCVTIGGQTEYGDDATNELSFLCLEVEADVHMPQPEIAVRLYKNSPPDFIEKVVDLISTGSGKIKIFNDEAVIPAFTAKDYSIKDARNYALYGCIDPNVPAKSCAFMGGGMDNMPKALELALNNGVCRITGKQIGPQTGDPNGFTSIEQILAAYKEQISHVVKNHVILNNTMEIAHNDLVPTPFQAALTAECLERGQDVYGGGAVYNITMVSGVGIANVADSLAAIQKVVYCDKLVSLAELNKMLESNFKNNEDFRLLLEHKVPKFGNDLDEVDFFVKKATDIYFDEVDKYRNMRGGKYCSALLSVTSNISYGYWVGASPDGRKARKPLADGGISPSQGKCLAGPTAVLKSVSKIDHKRATLGALLNMRFQKNMLQEQKGRINFAHLLRAFVDLGIYHVQFNVFSVETLRDAQKHPEKYRDLLIRVAGYSAFFVDLSPIVQEDILARTEFTAI